MAVSFDRKLLITVANKALKEHAAAQKIYDREVDKFTARHAADHAAWTRDNAKKLRDHLTVLLRKQGPVYSDDVRKVLKGEYRIDNLFYTGLSRYSVIDGVTAPKGLLSPAEVSETKALLEVLNAATGDKVTANELKLLGLKNLAPIFKAAGVTR